MIRIARADQVLAYAAFERVRQPLLAEPGNHLDQPVAVWVGASDRGLPMAFMARSVSEILNTPFEVLYGTHGVGHKKFMRLVHLLQRAAISSAKRERAAAGPNHHESISAQSNAAPSSFIAAELQTSRMLPVGVDDERVANDMWDQWRATALRFDLGHETLGRLTRSLHGLPRPLWRTPLGYYAALPMSAIEDLPAHGSKRINAVLEVFDDLHRMLAAIEPTSHASISVLPKCVAQLDRWSCGVLLHGDCPKLEEIETCFIRPIAEQIEIDAEPQLAAWAIRYLHADGSPPRSSGLVPTPFQTKKLADILHVRWPEGVTHVRALTARASHHDQPEIRERFAAVANLFFAAGHYTLPREAVLA